MIKEGRQTHCLLFWLLEDPQALHQSTSPDLLESCLGRTMDFEGTTPGLLEDQIGRYQLLRIYYLFFSFGIFTFIYELINFPNFIFSKNLFFSSLFLLFAS